MIFKDGKPVNRQVGLSVTSLIKALKEHGANLEVRLRVTAELLFHWSFEQLAFDGARVTEVSLLALE